AGDVGAPHRHAAANRSSASRATGCSRAASSARAARISVRIDGSQNFLRCCCTPAAASSGGYASKNSAIWLIILTRSSCRMRRLVRECDDRTVRAATQDRQPERGGPVEREAGRRGDGRERRGAGGRRLVNELETAPAGHHDEAVVVESARS